MVKYYSIHLDEIYGALSDGTRRVIVEQLAALEMSVSALAGPLPVSLPAISKHLRVLEIAGLLQREKQGRHIYCRLLTGPLLSAGDWLAGYRAFWQGRFAALEKYLRAEQAETVRRSTGRPRQRSNVARYKNQKHNRGRVANRFFPDIPSLDSTFSALSDATRRKILAQLQAGAAAVTELSKPFDISLPAISKHVMVLENAGLLAREKEGRMQYCHLRTAPLKEAADWIARCSR